MCNCVFMCVCACVCVSHLEHFPSDELVTRLTLNSKIDLIVPLTVGGAIPERKYMWSFENTYVGIFDIPMINTVGVSSLLADVLASQHFAAGFALEAAQVPLSVQRQKSLAIFNVSTTSCAICEKHKNSRDLRKGLVRLIRQKWLHLFLYFFQRVRVKICL